MNKGTLIGGIACLALAALLGVLALLMPDKIMYYVEGVNRPWVPPAVFGVVGVVLLAVAFGGALIGGQKAAAATPPKAIVIDPAKAALNKRLETIGWGCFLVMLGGFLLVPQTVIAKGLWSVGVGLIMLGLNAARYLKGIRMSGFTTFLGVISVIGGIAQLAGLNAIEGAFFLIILGVFVLAKPWFDKRQLFGKAEEA
ncbi:MAG: hypothetical protein FJ011_17765 [Chloroflexi bacterium]|nr:hypothetical protein [Chloroflexota bacterium]